MFNNIRNLTLLISLLFYIHINISAQIIIKEIQFNGLERTNIEHLTYYLKCSVGDSLDINKIEEDEVFLRNTQYFSQAHYSIREEGNNAILVFDLKEKRTLLPIANFNVIKSNYFIQLGAVEYNLFGNWNTFGGYFQHYDRNSISLFTDLKYIFKSRIGLIGRYNKISTTEPAYFDNGTTFFDVDKYSTELIFTYDFSNYILRNPNIIFGFGFNYLKEEYIKNFEKSGENSPGPIDDDREKLILKSTFSFSDLNYFYEYLNGISIKTYYDVVSEKNDILGFHQILSEFRYYNRIYSQFNIAARLRIGISSNKFSPFIPFYIDNYTNVRGAGDRVARGSAELSLNFELRSSIFRNSWTALQLVNFIDYGSLRPGGDKFKSLFNKDNIFSSAGLGIRIHLLNFYNAIFRLDYGFTLQNKSKDFMIFGLGHYF